MSVRLIAHSIWRNPGNRGCRIWKSLTAIAWQLRKRTCPAPRVLTLANGALFKAYPDCVVSSSLIYADWPEFHELGFLRNFLRPGELIIDVGANVGHVSLLLSDVVGSSNLYCFEPTPITFSRLVENWQLNGWPVGGLIQAAVGADDGTALMSDVSRPVTTNSVVENAAAPNTVAVKMVCLDSCRTLFSARRIGLLKLDVEGYESEVFLGSRKLLGEQRPRMIMFECLTPQLPESIREALESARYRVFCLDRTGKPDFNVTNAQNLFAYPIEEILP